MDEISSKSRRLLNPVDRSGQILFGLIMALTFTSSVSVAHSDHPEVKEILIAALTCNFAWGLVDAAMYLIGILVYKSKERITLDSIRNANTSEEARMHIAEVVPPSVTSKLHAEEIDAIRTKLMNLPDPGAPVTLALEDIKKAFAIFLLTSISTFPVTVPFLLFDETTTALRVSNLIAISLMFLCGWNVARYVGLNPWRTAVVIAVAGITLVVITISLGG